MKRLGPELKMPKLKGGEMKVPPFLSDLYFDLRERRLLPLVALILVAIVATPILLAGGSSELEPAPAPGPSIEGPSTSSSERTLTVVKAAPGLRNYKKRLGHRKATNPFKQRFDGPRAAGGQLQETTTTSSSGSSSTTTESSTRVEYETTVTAPSDGSGGSSSGGGGDQSEGVPPGLTYYTFAIDVEITRIESKPDGSVEKSGPTLHKEVLAPAPLPGEKAPVVTFMGSGTKDHLPLLMVSPEVTAVFGEGKCVSGTGSCQLLAVEPGFPETFEYGPNHVRYKINIVKLYAVATGHS